MMPERRGTMQGTIALVGSGEYLPPMEPVDRWLLQRVPGPPHVVSLPTAAGAEGRARVNYWMDLGVSHFQRLGAQAEGVPVIDRASAEDSGCAQRIREANFVYLSGGKPNYLYDTLAGTAVWGAILEVLNGGGVLAGCSAGAMVCGQRAVPRGRHPGFNLLPGAVIIPHYDELPHCDELPVRVASLLKVWLARRATLVGIDGNTALAVSQLHKDEIPPGSTPAIHRTIERSAREPLVPTALRLQIIGAGSVTIWGSSGPIRYCGGEELWWG